MGEVSPCLPVPLPSLGLELGLTLGGGKACSKQWPSRLGSGLCSSLCPDRD